MSPIWLGPSAVAPAQVRRLSDDALEATAPVQRVTVELVPAAVVVPRQIDPVALRLLALQIENEQLRSELEQVRPA